MSQNIKAALLDSVGSLRQSAEAIGDEDGGAFLADRLMEIADDLEAYAEELGTRNYVRR